MGNVSRFMDNLTGKRRRIFLILIILFCALAVGLAIYSVCFYEFSDSDPLMLSIHTETNNTNEEYAELKTNFSNLFTNELHTNNESIRVDKITTDQQVVFSDSSIVYEDEAYCDVNVKLPTLNIDTDTAKEINAEIKKEFSDTANVILKQQTQYIIYKVSFVAYVNENIVSIAIKEDAKYGTSSETTRIKTYNYNISTDKEISLSELIDLKGTTESEVQETIDSTIKTAYENSLGIADEYGTGFTRNLDDKRYKIKNTEAYFLTEDGYVYIVYAYGEDAETNEMDIVIF